MMPKVREAIDRIYDEHREALFNNGDAPLTNAKLPNFNYQAIAEYWKDKARAIFEDAYLLAKQFNQ